MSNIAELRDIVSNIAVKITYAEELTLKMSLESGNETLDKHVDSIRNTINQLSICLGVLNVKVLRASKFESSKNKEVNFASESASIIGHSRSAPMIRL